MLKGKSIDFEKINKYLDKSNLPKISHYCKENLNKKITAEEIKRAIEEAKVGKSPGPDGMTVRFYRIVKEELGPYLQEIMNLIMVKTEMPKSWNQESITLIPKDSTDPINVKNYRPISLLNNDYKLFAKILADRLKEYLRNYISEEQTGFLPNRHLKDNIRTIINVIEFL